MMDNHRKLLITSLSQREIVGFFDYICNNNKNKIISLKDGHIDLRIESTSNLFLLLLQIKQ